MQRRLWHAGLEGAAVAGKPFWDVFCGLEESNAVVRPTSPRCSLSEPAGGHVDGISLLQCRAHRNSLHAVQKQKAVAAAACAGGGFALGGMRAAATGIADATPVTLVFRHALCPALPACLTRGQQALLSLMRASDLHG